MYRRAAADRGSYPGMRRLPNSTRTSSPILGSSTRQFGTYQSTKTSVGLTISAIGTPATKGLADMCDIRENDGGESSCCNPGGVRSANEIVIKRACPHGVKN